MENTTDSKLDEILKAIKSLDGRIARIESGNSRNKMVSEVSAEREVSNRRVSVKEFLMECSPKGDVQKTLAIGYFLERFEGMSSFNKTDVERAYQAIKEKPPLNINDKANMSIRNGHLREEEEKKESKKAWAITPSGERYIKDGFKKKVNPK